MKKTLPFLISFWILFPTTPVNAHHKLKIVASFSILGDMVHQITGDLAEITTIVGPDADAHVYTPTASDAKSVKNADLIFVNGLGFETWAKSLIQTSGTQATVSVATYGIEPLMVDGEVDPHAWNSLKNGIIYIRNIADTLATKDPKNALVYRANHKAYSDRLAALHNRALTKIKQLPDNRRTVVTAHDAFGYLESSYQLNFLAPIGIDTAAEPSASGLAKLIDHLKKIGAGALFMENITSPALIQQISRETGIKIGGQLFSDALSVRGGPAIRYEKMFEHNFNSIIAALQPST